MFIPHEYKNENLADVKSFLREHSFGILLSQGDGRISGTHIPMELDIDENGNDVLVGHIAKANPQSKNLRNEEDILAIFNGPHSYISSSWYEEERVPTWNYVAVHIYGKVQIMEGPALIAALKKLVDKYEQHSKNPVSVAKMSSRTMKQVHGIVGFSIKINEVQAAYKLSQNRTTTDYHNITTELEKEGSANAKAISEVMKKAKK
jgi:transcriptional regulator